MGLFPSHAWYTVLVGDNGTKQQPAGRSAPRRGALKGLERNLLHARDLKELGSQAKLLLNLSKVIPHEMRRAGSWAAFEEMVRGHVWPTARRELDALGRTAGDVRRFEAWRERYTRALHAFLESATAQLELVDVRRLEPTFRKLQSDLPPGVKRLSWAQQALGWAASRPGVTAALSGMRSQSYVTQALALVPALRGEA